MDGIFSSTKVTKRLNRRKFHWCHTEIARRARLKSYTHLL